MRMTRRRPFGGALGRRLSWAAPVSHPPRFWSDPVRVPGLARALMLEAASLAMHATPSFVVDVLAVVGECAFPRRGRVPVLVRLLARPGIAVLERLRHVVRTRVGAEGDRC